MRVVCSSIPPSLARPAANGGGSGAVQTLDNGIRHVDQTFPSRLPDTEGTVFHWINRGFLLGLADVPTHKDFLVPLKPDPGIFLSSRRAIEISESRSQNATKAADRAYRLQILVTQKEGGRRVIFGLIFRSDRTSNLVRRCNRFLETSSLTYTTEIHS